MLLQTNSYVVPLEKRAAHAKLLQAFRQALARIGCDLFEIYEQAGPNWDTAQGEGRFVQIMRFRDREHQLAVQAAERKDADAQRLISEFCELINFPYQQEHGLFAIGFYTEMSAATPAAPFVRPPAPTAVATPTTPPGPTSRPAVDVEAYIERELDDIISSFGDPRDMLVEPPAASRPSAPKKERENPPSSFPRLAKPADAQPDDDQLDALLEEQFAPAAPEAHNPTPADSELGRVLDEGLAEDELDIALPAELLDDEDDSQLEADTPSAPPQAEPPKSKKRVARR